MTSLVPLLRRSAVVAAASLALVTLAGPAGADTPEGWPEEQSMDALHSLLLMVGIPLAIGLVILALVYVPALVRGERVAPGAPEVQNQWLGGPRKDPHELAAPGDEDTPAGGASARW